MINFAKHSRLLLAFTGVVLVFAFSSEVRAIGPVTFTADTTISVGGFTLNLLSGSSAIEFTVASDTISVTLGGDDTFTVTSASHNNLTVTSGPAGNFVCGAAFSSLVVSRSATSIITPSATTCTPPPAVVVNTGGGAPPGVNINVPPAVPPSVTPEKDEEEALEFKDVPATDKFIMPLVNLMLEKKTYQFSQNKIYGTKKITKGNFALQIGLGVSDLKLGFEKFPGTKKIRETAVATWPDVAKNWPRGKISRYDFYELLLAVRGISKLENKTVKDLKEACSDVKKPTTNMTQVYFTAKKFGIAVRYKGGKCRLHMPFSRKEAAKFVRFRFPGEP